MTDNDFAPRPHARRSFIVAGCALLLSACTGPGGGGNRTAAYRRPVVVAAAHRSEVVLTALSLLESQYRYGGSHPAGGFDCSGLVAYVFSQSAGQSLPHNTAQIAALSRKIATRNLKPGDFVFFNTLNRPNSHMGIYIGDKAFINAPSSGGRVRIDSLDSPYFSKRFESARTVFSA